MQEIEKYLYHGLNYNVVSTIDTLESILKAGYIMNRQTLKQNLPPSEFKEFEKIHKANWNGVDAISITCNPKNIELIEKYNITLPRDKYDDAYLGYIICSTVLILDPLLLEHYEQKQKSFKMGYEIQILGNIPLSYIKAIGIRTNKDTCMNPFSPKNIYRLKAILNELQNGYKGKNFTKYYDDTTNLRVDFINCNLEEIYKRCIYTNYIPALKKLLKDYDLDIPIVDLEYGYILPSSEIQKKRIKQLRKKFDNYNKSRINKA